MYPKNRLTDIEHRTVVAKSGGMGWLGSLGLLFSHQVVSNSLQPHGQQHTKLSCLSSYPSVCPSSYPLGQ